MQSKAPKDTEKEIKLDASLIPLDLLIDFLVIPYEEGILKYYKNSWREGFTTTSMIAALLRHLTAYQEGENYDPDTYKQFKIKKHHLGAMLFCVLCMCDTFKNHPELDDRGTTKIKGASFKKNIKESVEQIKKWKKYTQTIQENQNENYRPEL